MTKKIGFSVVLAIAFLLSAAMSDAATINLPKTGQTICYDATTNGIIDCAGTGQDGKFQKGVAWPNPRFIDNGDGTITDNLTGLIWLKNANCVGSGNYRDWPTALSDVAQLNTNGTMNGNNCGDTSNGGSHQTDWRLPNINELESLINAGQANPTDWLLAQGFINVEADYYWSSTTNAEDTNNALYVYMGDGFVYFNDKLLGSLYVWAVRGSTTGPAQVWKTGQTICYDAANNPTVCTGTGQDGEFQKGVAWPNPRFTNNGNGTVTDNLTGLIWLKNADCFGTRTWANALTDTINLVSGSCGLTDGSQGGDWRLPNRKELLSLVDWSSFNPALSAGHPFDNVIGNYMYWSSTTNENDLAYAWQIIMYFGDIHSSLRNGAETLHVWPVRGGVGSPAYTVTYDGNGHDGGSPPTDANNYETGDTVTALGNTGSLVKAGFVFSGWNTQADGGGTDRAVGSTFNMGASNVTLYAKWTAVYTLTVTKAGTGTGTVTAGANCTLNWAGNTGACTVNDGTAITLSGSPNASSTFTGWSGGSGSAAACNGAGACSFNLTADSGVTATFTLNQYTVTPSAGANGTIAPNTPQTVNHGSTTQFTVTPDAGYTASVGGTCGGTLVGNTYTTNAITADCTVDATFTLNQYTITTSANPAAGGSVSCSPNPVDHGSASTCTITTNAGYTLQGVGGTCGGTLVGNTYTTNAITANCTVEATFTLNPYPDLIVPLVDGPSTGFHSSMITITATVQNIGGVPLVVDPQRPLAVRFYLSTDTTITPADAYIGVYYIAGGRVLNPGDTITIVKRLRLPYNVTGTYYIGAIADATGLYVESNEANNTGFDPAVINIQ